MIGLNGHPTVIDAELGVLTVQPAFVEAVERDGKRFSSLEAAFAHVFRNNLEWGIVLWSDVPVRISYRDDLPVMLNPLLDLLVYASGMEKQGHTSFHFETPNLHTTWSAEISGEMIGISAGWRHLNGGYESALNQVPMIWMSVRDFLCEWKLLLQQLLQAFDDSGARLTRRDARNRFEMMQRIEAGIPARGRFYKYTENHTRRPTGPGRTD